MVIEASSILKAPVLDVTGRKVGSVDTCVYRADEARLYGLQVSRGSVVSKFGSLLIDDIISLGSKSVIVDSGELIGKHLKDLDSIAKETGTIIGVKAVTESGKVLGKVFDLLFDSDTGFIVRFYIRRHVLSERIIPRQFLVSITPKQIVFRDVVDTPIFDQVATQAEATPA